jgi:hypothetical protein
MSLSCHSSLNSLFSPPASPRTPPEFASPERRFQAAVRPLPNTPSDLIGLRDRPEWWNATHRTLQSMAIANQEEPVDPRHFESIRAVASTLKTPVEMFWFLKLSSEFIFQGTTDLFFPVLRNLLDSSPALTPYFYELPDSEPGDGPVFTGPAIAQIFRFFEEQYKFPPGVLSTQPLSKLPELIEEMMSGANNTARGFAVQNDLFSEDPHIVPVFATKTGGKTHVFIFDSLGHSIEKERRFTQISASLEELIKHFRDSTDLFEQFAIYSYQNKRQRSAMGCGVFTVLDLKNLLERHLHEPGNIVTFYDSQAPDHQPRLIIQELTDGTSLPVYEIDTIPPEMIKVTQSLSTVRSYRESPPVLDPAQIPFFKRCVAKSWQKEELVPQDLATASHSINQIIRVDQKGTSQNLYITQKRLSLIVCLLAPYFKEAPPSLKTPSARRALFSTPELLVTGAKAAAATAPQEGLKV